MVPFVFGVDAVAAAASRVLNITWLSVAKWLRPSPLTTSASILTSAHLCTGSHAGGNVVFLLVVGSGGDCPRGRGLRECLGLRHGAGVGAWVTKRIVRWVGSHAAPGSAGVSQRSHHDAPAGTFDQLVKRRDPPYSWFGLGLGLSLLRCLGCVLIGLLRVRVPCLCRYSGGLEGEIRDLRTIVRPREMYELPSPTPPTSISTTINGVQVLPNALSFT